MRDMARELAQDTEPLLIMRTPMCKAFSALQALSKSRRDNENHLIEYFDIIKDLRTLSHHGFLQTML